MIRVLEEAALFPGGARAVSLAGRGTARAKRSEKTEGVSDKEKAYFAGYTDAEGCIGICPFKRGRTVYWYAFVTFSQTQPEVVERMHAVYGGHLLAHKRGHRRRQKTLRIQALDSVKRFLCDVMPHLREKRDQAALVLNFDPKAELSANENLSNLLVKMKAAPLRAMTGISRLAIEKQKHAACRLCATQAFSRGYCAKHYSKARREGWFVTNPKGTGVPFIRGRDLREHEASYIAGYFDGDGCISIAKENERWYPRIAFAQTQSDTLLELQAIYGGSLTLRPAKGVRRPALAYQLVQRGAVFAMLHDMSPYLVEKRGQVELFLKSYSADMLFEEGALLKIKLSEMKQRTFG